MNIEFKFENPHTYWNPLIVFKNYYSWIENNQNGHSLIYTNTIPSERGNPSGPSSPHIMTIRNLETRKYIIVSYWDRAVEFTWEGNGWDTENRVDIITSAGVHCDMEYTPFSYTTYSLEFEKYASTDRKPWSEKTDSSLLFRGFLYAERKLMQTLRPDLFSEERKTIREYFDELNNTKISLSLNGAGEICNRDMEILCSGSVLLRPELTQKFHNPLIPNVHYISVEKVSDGKTQLELLLKKYEEIKDNFDFLNTIGNNGLRWFEQNGSMEANVELLKKLINLEKLN